MVNIYNMNPIRIIEKYSVLFEMQRGNPFIFGRRFCITERPKILISDGKIVKEIYSNEVEPLVKFGYLSYN